MVRCEVTAASVVCIPSVVIVVVMVVVALDSDIYYGTCILPTILSARLP